MGADLAEAFLLNKQVDDSAHVASSGRTHP